jgi:hypothetical protein
MLKGYIADGMILTGSVLAQAVSLDPTTAGTMLGKLAPSALLGIGILWAIKRGDAAYRENQDLRNARERELKEEQADMRKVLKETVEGITASNKALEHNNRIIEHCERMGGKK